MLNLCCLKAPTVSMDHLPASQLAHHGSRSSSGQTATPLLVDEVTTGVLRPGGQVGVKGAAVPKETIRHLLCLFGAKDLQFWDTPPTLIPATQNQIALVDTVIIVLMGQKEARDVVRRRAALQKPPHTMRPAVDEKSFIIEGDQEAGASPVEEGGWRTCAQ